MYSHLWYGFLKSDEIASSIFQNAFNSENTYEYVNNRNDIYLSCFGSYGMMYNRNPNGEFYFSLAGYEDRIDEAVKHFNSKFENIKFVIVAKKPMVYVNSSWTSYSVPEEKVNAIKNMHPSYDYISYNAYLLRIEFDPGYNSLTKYALRIPLGFFIRMYSTYHNAMNDYELTGDYILDALNCSNNDTMNNAAYISDYITDLATFMAMDDIELTNKLFSTSRRVCYHENYVSLEFGNSVKPYSIYFHISRGK